MRLPATTFACALALAACSGEAPPPADTGALPDTPAVEAPTGTAPERDDGLPAGVADAVRAAHPGLLRYLAGSIDLSGDGEPEIVVHVVGPMVCGTGGCPTMVFTPDASGHRLVSTISVTRPPILASETRTNGWRDLIVRIGGGGGRSGDVGLAFDGTTYPSNPTVTAPGVRDAAGEEAETVVAEFESFEDTVPLPNPEEVGSASGRSGGLTIGPLAVTRAACPPPSMGEKIAGDAEYVRGYRIDEEGRLGISLMADAGIYLWEPDPSGGS